MGYRVLMLAPTSFFSDYGCHVRILEEILYLQGKGHKVTVCAYRKGKDVPGIEIKRIPPLPGDNRYELGASWIKVIFDVFLGLRSLLTSLGSKFDLIHAHLHEGAFIGYFLSKLWRVPLVFDFQGSLTDEMIQHGILRSGGLVYKLMCRLEVAIDHLPDAIITSTAHGARLLKEKFNCNPAKVVEIPDCVNVERFRPRTPSDEGRVQALKKKLGIPEDRKVVVYLGLLSTYQGTELLLEAAADLLREGSEAHFLIMGFPGEAFYREKAESLGIGKYVTFTGRIPYMEAPEYLRLGDVAVAPKLSASEGNGKLLVYMATGLPVAAFDTSVNKEYLGNYASYAAPGDAYALSRALRRLLEDEGLASSIGNTLRERAVQRYKWERAGEKLLSLYETLLDARKPRW